MIRYSLVCENRHEFESWFQSSSAFDKQAKRGLVHCPVCESAKVEKAIMAPQVAPKGARNKAEPEKTPVAMMSPQEQDIRSKLKELREHITKNADHVGEKIPEEARKMHYGEIEHRSIYGQASAEEAKSLVDEGIEFHPLPILPDEQN